MSTHTGTAQNENYCEARTFWVSFSKGFISPPLSFSFWPNSMPWKVSLDDRYWLPNAVPKPHPRPSPTPQPPPLKKNVHVND